MWIDMGQPPIPMTFREAAKKIDIWEGTGVLEEDKKNLHTALDLEVLCDERIDVWLFYWKRALLMNYPVYRDQAEMWLERKLHKWLFDNFKEIVTEHEGTFRLDETTRNDIVSNIMRNIHDDLTGTFQGTTTRNSDTTERIDEDGASEDHSEDETNSKTRAFSFSYPESNYTGGVIPYDIEDNPSVEFINSQSDSIGRTNSVHDGTSEYTSGTDRTGHTTEITKTDSTTNSDEDRTEEQDETKTDEGVKGQDTLTHWIEKVNRQGDNLNSLVDGLIAQIPMTDFFKQFVDKMLVCFKRTFAPWDI